MANPIVTILYHRQQTTTKENRNACPSVASYTMSDEQINMDAILNAALDELDDDDDDNEDPDDQDIKVNHEAQAKEVAGDVGSLHPPQQTRDNTARESLDIEDDEMEQLNTMMNEIMRATIGGGSGSADNNNDDLCQIMANLQQQMEMEMKQQQKKKKEKSRPPPKEVETTTHSKEAASGNDPSATPPRRPVFGPEPPPPRSTNVDRTISNLLNSMAASAATQSDDNNVLEDNDDDDDIDDMMKQFQSLGGDDMIDGMMQQLMAKDLMYEPIKEVTAKFPKWLSVNKESLSEDEYNK